MRLCDRGADTADRHLHRHTTPPTDDTITTGDTTRKRRENIVKYDEEAITKQNTAANQRQKHKAVIGIENDNNNSSEQTINKQCGDAKERNNNYSADNLSHCKKVVRKHSKEATAKQNEELNFIGDHCCSKEAKTRLNAEPFYRHSTDNKKRNEDNISKSRRSSVRRHCSEDILSKRYQEESSRRYHGDLSQKPCKQGIRRHSGASNLWRRNGAGGAILLCILLLLSLRGSCGSASLGAQLVCARAPALTEKQRALCRASPAAMAAIATGLRMAYVECVSQMSGRRWNCSGVGDSNHFSHVMPLATREAAYTYAITSAGVTHALSAACARGELPACGCDHRRHVVGAGEQWEWGAGGGGGARGAGGGGVSRCGEVAYGARLARRFLDARELERDARTLMNLHNNRLGRKMVKELVRRECKCHGVSGSCAVRTCWRALPAFRAVAAALTDKYTRAKMVSPVERGTSIDGQSNIQLLVKRRGTSGTGRAARKNELVFLAASPSYCEPDAAAGALGTHGRHCNNTSRGPDGCGSLCCGRGYSSLVVTARVQCRCQFQWCCRVRCDTCLTTTELHVCN